MSARDCRGPISFRDPAGHVYITGNAVHRLVRSHAAPQALGFLSGTLARGWVEAKKLAAYKILEGPPAMLDSEPDGGVWLECEPVSFPNYPHEWSPEMLYEAAVLTLELADE